MKSILYFCILAAFFQFSYGDNNEAERDYPPAISGNAKMRAEVRKSIFNDYDKLNIPDNPNVKFGLTVVNIDVDEEKQTLEADIWLRMSWSDDRLQWDNVSTGVNVLRIGHDEIWKPDITLYNSATPAEMMACTETMPLIYSGGSALWVPPCHISAYCNMTLQEHPLGEQSCKLKFGSWVYDGLIMNIQLEGKAKADISNYLSNKWAITKNIANRKDTYYPCCPEPYPSLNFNLSFKRKTSRNSRDMPLEVDNTTMASWISDGSNGFTTKGDVVTYVNNQRGDGGYSAMWQEADGVSSGKHYWKIHFPTLINGAGVGLTSKDYFETGYAGKVIIYSGNLSNGLALLVGSFGPGPKQGDVIGIFAVFEGDRLKVYIDVNGASLGLAFDVPASTFKSIFPVVSFHDSGSATCSKQTEIPTTTDRAPTTFDGINGDWKLTNLKQHNVASCLPFVPESVIREQATDKYSWYVRVVNSILTDLSKEDGKWKTSRVYSSYVGTDSKTMKLENKIIALMENVKIIEVNGSGNLFVVSDTMSSTWARHDQTPKPFVGDPIVGNILKSGISAKLTDYLATLTYLLGNLKSSIFGYCD